MKKEITSTYENNAFLSFHRNSLRQQRFWKIKKYFFYKYDKWDVSYNTNFTVPDIPRLIHIKFWLFPHHSVHMESFQIFAVIILVNPGAYIGSEL